MKALREYVIRINREHSPYLKWLSVGVCRECRALIEEDQMEEHLAWHARTGTT